MELTKYAHACICVDHEDERILVDPGTLTPETPALLAQADLVLITHSHFDHFDADAVRAALAARPELAVFGPADVVSTLTEAGAHPEQVHVVEGGERLDRAGLDITAVGGPHAAIHDGIPVPRNIGYLLGGTVYHPGDSYLVPDFPVDTLLVPSSGPWTKVGEAIDFVRAVAPRRTVPIHELMLSELGTGSFAMFIGENGLTGVPLHQLAPGESLEL